MSDLTRFGLLICTTSARMIIDHRGPFSFALLELFIRSLSYFEKPLKAREAMPRTHHQNSHADLGPLISS